MSTNNKMRRTNIRWQLLVSVSSMALLGSAYGAGVAEAAGADGDRPLIWIELGGQLEGLNNPQEQFSPSFLASITHESLLSALNVQRPPAYAIGDEGKISFQPDGSDWVFSASIRYGRSKASRHRHQQTPNKTFALHIPTLALFGIPSNYYKYPVLHKRFSDGKATESEVHTVLDFQAGKDVGLGMFGGRSTSVLSAGVRFAQFTSKSNVNLRALPDLQYPTKPITTVPAFLAFYSGGNQILFHAYAAAASIQRSFRGVGPSLAWNASVPFAGDSERGELTLDWGANAAILFGRQKAKGHHQTAVQTYYDTRWKKGSEYDGVFRGHFFNAAAQHTYYTAGAVAHHTNAPPGFDRVKSVTVPNFGAFAGLSYRYADAKISLGYRADFFFNAIDGGIDTHKSENRGFYGPYASISIGIGD